MPPCSSDYLRPSQEEKNRKRIARLMLYVMHELKYMPVGNERRRYQRAATNPYGEGIDLNKETKKLCGVIQRMSEGTLNRIVYNARSKDSRDLADWWEEHQRADNKRKKRERDEKRRKRLIKSAMSKLTREERQALENRR